MKVPDANVLLYAADDSSPRQARARAWLDGHLGSLEAVGFTWIALLAAIRLATNPALYERPLSPDEAMDLVDLWLAQPASTIIHPTERHPQLLRELLSAAGTAGNLTSDAHLAAIAIEHGATLASFDGDFHRFSGLRFEHLT